MQLYVGTLRRSARLAARVFFCAALVGFANAQPDASRAMRELAVTKVVPLAAIDEDIPRAADMRELQKIYGSARVIAFGEPLHGAHEPLAVRNRIIHHAVAEMGVTAIALETGIGTAKALYDYVLGGPDPGESALRGAFSYGFGRFPENLQLLRWMRTWNASHPEDRKVRLYGFDLSGQVFPYAYRSVEAALRFVERADPTLGATLRRDCAGLLANLRSDRYLGLGQPERDELTRHIQDLIATMRRERDVLVAGGSLDDYDWALQQAIAAGQDDDFLRLLPGDRSGQISPTARPRDPRWDHSREMREMAMAQNIEWIERRTQGRTLLFAHDWHVQKVAHRFSGPDANRFAYSSYRPLGMYLKERYSSEYRAVGSLDGSGKGVGADEFVLEGSEFARVFSAARSSRFVLDLRSLPQRGPLRAWFDAEHAIREEGFAPLVLERNLSLSKAFDAIIWLGAVTPFHP